MTTFYSAITVRVIGDTKYLDGSVTDSQGAVVNITGAAITYQVLTGDGIVKLTKTVGAGVAITNGAGGIYVVTISSADLATLPFGDYLEKATMVLAGDTGCLFEGNLEYKL